MITDTDPVPTPVEPDADESFELEVFYDGGCPLCRREIAFLQRLDRRQRIRFTDIDTPGFDAAERGRTGEELMAHIHGLLPDGRWIVGVEVFRRLYGAVGFGWLAAASRWPLVSQGLELGYRYFARWRLRRRQRCGATCAISNDHVSPSGRPGSRP